MDATPAQIVFGRDMLFDLSFTRDWNVTKKKRQRVIEHNNKRENSKQTRYQFQPNNNVLLERNLLQQKLYPKRDGPYDVVRVYPNGTLKLHKGIVTQNVSIRRCVPYHSRENPN